MSDRNKDIEYQTLRDEMMQLFDRIKTITVLWVGSFGAIIAFYLSSATSESNVNINPPINDAYALVILLILIHTCSMYVIRMQNNIYKLGTFIAVEHEGKDLNRWHRMNRQFDNFLKTQDKSCSIGFFKFSIAWGSDTLLYGILTPILTGVATIVVLNRAGKDNPLSLFDGFSFEWLCNAIVIGLYIGIVVNVITIFLTPKIYKKELKVRWKEYAAKFGTEDFQDEYEQ